MVGGREWRPHAPHGAKSKKKKKKDGNRIRNVENNIVIGTSFKTDCTIEVLYDKAKVLNIRLTDTNDYFGSDGNGKVFLTKEKKTDQIIWIS